VTRLVGAIVVCDVLVVACDVLVVGYPGYAQVLVDDEDPAPVVYRLNKGRGMYITCESRRLSLIYPGSCEQRGSSTGGVSHEPRSRYVTFRIH
jgi:hypothetical protein